jgi:guanylate kinase
VAAGGFFEYAQVHGHYYGTPRREVEASLRRGQSLILVIDVQGGAAVKGRRPDSVLVFLVPPSLAELRRRLIGRGTDSPAAVRRRLREASRECAAALNYDYLIINDKLDKTVEALVQVCQAARHRLSR